MEVLRKKLFMAALAGTATIETSNYLTIRALSDNVSISFSNDVSCNRNGARWVTLASGQTVSVNNDEYVCFKKEVSSVTDGGVGQFTVSGNFALEGNCMSMLFGDDAKDSYDLTGYNYAFYQMFYNCSGLKSVSTGFLPATTLAECCYRYMFKDCTSLVNAPELPATELANYCYNCMFYDCTSLVNAPELPATILVNFCYNSMFNNCIKLNYIKMLATDISASGCISSWVRNVSPSGTFVKNKNATWDVRGQHGIPEGWTVLTE